MLGAAFIQFGRAHHAHFAMKLFGEQGRAQIVTSHVRGKNDRAFACEQIVEHVGAV